MFRKLFLLAALGGSLVLTDVATASSPTPLEAAMRIDIAGRQRMLVQRIARSACLALGGVEARRHSDMAWSDIALYNTSLAALRDGNPAMELTKQTNPVVLDLLTEAQHLWRDFEPAAQQLVSGDLHSVVVSQLIEKTNPTMAAAHEVVVALAQNSGSSIDPKLAKTINLAGRQRMLSQRATKEFCFLHLGIASNAAETLTATIDLFDKTLKDLQNGTNGLIAPPNGTVVALLAEVDVLWHDLRHYFDKRIAGHALTDADLKALSELSDRVLFTMNQAVGAYAS